MSEVVNVLKAPAEFLASAVGLGGAYKSTAAAAGLPGYSAKAPTMPQAPTIDDASTAAQQTQDMMRRRRGVLSNIYAGNQQSAAPTVSTTNLLGK